MTGALSLLHEPSVEISPDITKLTGITSEMVAGCRLDLDAVTALLKPADLLIAHNARFDRNFCERLHYDFRRKASACSVAEVKWGTYSDEAGRVFRFQAGHHSRLFRTFGAVPRAEQHNLRGLDHPSMQEIELSPTIPLPLDELEAVNVALDRAGAPWFGQSGLHCVAVTLQSSCK